MVPSSISSSRYGLFFLSFLILSAASLSARPSSDDDQSLSLVNLVDTRVGTGGVGFGDGSLNPGVQYPFGALRLGPDTTIAIEEKTSNGSKLIDLFLDFDHFGGYKHNDTYIRAFSHTHTVGAGVCDWGSIGVTVTRGIPTSSLIANTTSNPQYSSQFSHTTETAQPGYYAVNLDTPSVFTELSVTGTHTGIHQYTCQPTLGGSNNDCTLLIDICHTSSLPISCMDGNVTIVPLRTGTSTQPPVFAVTASMLNHGGLTGRSSLGGVWIHYYAEITVISNSSLPSYFYPNPSYGIWNTNILYPSVTQGGPNNATRGTMDNLGVYFVLGNASLTNPNGNVPLIMNVRVGLSFIDILHARNNLYNDQSINQSSTCITRIEEIGNDGPGVWQYSFSEIVTNAQTYWNTYLQRTTVSPIPGDTYPLRNIFTSATYRALLAPTTYSEWDGAYLGMDNNVHTILYPSNNSVLRCSSSSGTVFTPDSPTPPLYRYMSDMSLWDIHRTQTPWLTFVFPEVAADITRTLLTMNYQGGHLPRWPMANVYTGCMDGSHGIATMVDTYFACTPGVSIGGYNGQNNSDRTTIVSVLFNTTIVALESQAYSSHYATIGYVPTEDSDTPASSTLEYAFDDGIGYLLASSLSNGTWANRWYNRSQFYQNVWSSNDMTMCPKDLNGTFHCPFSKYLPYPIESGYVEGDAAQWQWFVPHDLAGLFSTSWQSNATAYTQYLHEVLYTQISWPFVAYNTSDWLPNYAYWAGNEPSLLIAYEFVVAGSPYVWLTQFWSSWLLHFYYIFTPEGVPGNDDYGTMSAWAAWTTLGLYPLTGTGKYILTTPSVNSANISLPMSIGPLTEGVQLQITVLNSTNSNTGSLNRYINTVYINNRLIKYPIITINDLLPNRVQYCSATGKEEDSGTGSSIVFTLTDTPREWGTGRILTPAELAPYALPPWPTMGNTETVENENGGNSEFIRRIRSSLIHPECSVEELTTDPTYCLSDKAAYALRHKRFGN